MSELHTHPDFLDFLTQNVIWQPTKSEMVSKSNRRLSSIIYLIIHRFLHATFLGYLVGFGPVKRKTKNISRIINRFIVFNSNDVDSVKKRTLTGSRQNKVQSAK